MPKVIIFRCIVVMGIFLSAIGHISAANQELSVTISTPMDGQIFRLGKDLPENLAVRARPTDWNVNYRWTWEGPGQLVDTNEKESGCSYVFPGTLAQPSAQVKITVTVTNEQGQTASGSVTLTLQTPEPSPTPIPTSLPTPTPSPTPLPTATPTPTVPPKILGVLLNDPFYYIPAGKTMTLMVDVPPGSGRDVRVECGAARGTARSESSVVTYTAPPKAGSKDLLYIKLRDTVTHKVLDQKAIVIKVIEDIP